MPLFGQPNVTKLTARRDTSALMKAMDSRDPNVEVAAIWALGELDYRNASVSLAVKTTARDPDVRAAAAAVLERWGTSPLDECIVALQDANMGARWGAAAALGEFGDPKATGPLIAALDDESPLVRDMARTSLKKLGHPAD